jgi:hypothetical protein
MPISYYEILTWKTHGTINCPQCESLAGTTMSAAEWGASIQPGFHKHCDCTLEVTDRIYFTVDVVQMEHITQSWKDQPGVSVEAWEKIRASYALDPKPEPVRTDSPSNVIPVYSYPSYPTTPIMPVFNDDLIIRDNM